MIERSLTIHEFYLVTPTTNAANAISTMVDHNNALRELRETIELSIETNEERNMEESSFRTRVIQLLTELVNEVKSRKENEN